MARDAQLAARRCFGDAMSLRLNLVEEVGDSKLAKNPTQLITIFPKRRTTTS